VCALPRQVQATLILTAEEIATLTGRKRKDAQARVLNHLGIEHRKRPDGSLVVLRSHVEQSTGSHGTMKDPEPNWSAL